MTLSVSLHNPNSLRVNTFESRGRMHSSMRFFDDDGGRLDIYTTPERAQRIADLWAEMDAEGLPHAPA